MFSRQFCQKHLQYYFVVNFNTLSAFYIRRHVKIKRWLNLRNTTIILKYYIKSSSQKSLVVAVSRHVTLYCNWENYTTISSEPNCLLLNYVKCISKSGRPNQHVKNMLYPMIMYRTKVLATTNAQQIPTMICYERMNIYIYIYIWVFFTCCNWC